MTTQLILTCPGFETSPEGVTSCPGQAWVESYVVPADQAAQLDLVLNGGFDPDTFTLFFSGTLLMFCVGLGIGLIFSNVRKLKSI